MARKKRNAVRSEVAIALFLQWSQTWLESGGLEHDDAERATALDALASTAFDVADIFSLAEQRWHKGEDREPAKKKGPVPIRILIESYKRHLPGNPRPRSLSAQMSEAIAAAYHAQDWDQEGWDQYFRHAGEQPFLTGDNQKGWKATMVWLMNHVPEVDSGQYSEPWNEPETRAPRTDGLTRRSGDSIANILAARTAVEARGAVGDPGGVLPDRPE